MSFLKQYLTPHPDHPNCTVVVLNNREASRQLRRWASTLNNIRSGKLNLSEEILAEVPEIIQGLGIQQHSIVWC